MLTSPRTRCIRCMGKSKAHVKCIVTKIIPGTSLWHNPRSRAQLVTPMYSNLKIQSTIVLQKEVRGVVPVGTQTYINIFEKESKRTSCPYHQLSVLLFSRQQKLHSNVRHRNFGNALIDPLYNRIMIICQFNLIFLFTIYIQIFHHSIKSAIFQVFR